MKNMISKSLKYEQGQIFILNQQKLPHGEEWLKSQTPDDMVEFIKELKIRGAPLIGVAACICLAQYALSGVSRGDVLLAEKKLRNSRPTAVNLMNGLDRMLSAYEVSGGKASSLEEMAEDIFFEDVQLCEKIAMNGSELVKKGEGILTHCNTGGLATVGVGTALGVIQRVHEKNKDIHVYVNETRPLLQGGRLTAWELDKAQVPYTLLCDSMAAHLMAEGKVDRVFVGADRIAKNGDFANKIGTYSLAVNAKYHDVPFYVVAPYTTIDVECEKGKDIPIEQRGEDEVRGVRGSFGSVVWSPKTCEVYNPAFDVTPASLVTGWVLDRGVFNRKEFYHFITGGI